MSAILAELRTELANKDDAQVFDAIVDTLLKSNKALSIGLDTQTQQHVFVVRIRNMNTFSDVDARRIAAISNRILDIDVLSSAAKIHVIVQRAQAPAAVRSRGTYMPLPATARRERTRDPGWAEIGINDNDDCRHLNSIISDVCDMHEVMPVVRTWLELIDRRRAGVGVMLPPRRANADESESESEANALVRADDPECVGFVLCFTAIPETFSAFFFDYLRESHGIFVTRVCVWFGGGGGSGASSTPTLTINVRKMSASSLSEKTLNEAHPPPHRDPSLSRKRARTSIDKSGSA